MALEELIEGLGGHIRTATIRTNARKTNRPVTKLFPLEVNAVDESSVIIRDDGNEQQGDDDKYYC